MRKKYLLAITENKEHERNKKMQLHWGEGEGKARGSSDRMESRSALSRADEPRGSKQKLRGGLKAGALTEMGGRVPGRLRRRDCRLVARALKHHLIFKIMFTNKIPNQ